MRRLTTTMLCALLGLGASACLSGSGSGSGSGTEYLNPPERGDSRPFSHVALTEDLAFIAGCLGIDPATGAPPAEVEAEVRLMLDAFRAKLELAGLGMDDLVSVQVFCSDVSHYDVFNDVYASCFSAASPGSFPVRAFVGSGPLLRGCRFEITGIAAR
jgi:2-iminobutanoate/2-iminopropanoate deaminase